MLQVSLKKWCKRGKKWGTAPQST